MRELIEQIAKALVDNPLSRNVHFPKLYVNGLAPVSRFKI
jgi:hypothetical protein